jgi:hypothetical protein
MCHASPQQQASFKTQTATTQTVNDNLDTIFSNNENILSGLKAQFVPLIQAGAHQYAFDHSEDVALRNEVGAAAATVNAVNAARSAAISEGAGTPGAPAGSQGSVDAGIAQAIAQKQNEYSNRVTAAGYEAGTQNFDAAGRILPGATGTLEGEINQAGGAAQDAAGQQSRAAQTITAANDAWITPVAGAMGATISGLKPSNNTYVPDPANGPGGPNGESLPLGGTPFGGSGDMFANPSPLIGGDNLPLGNGMGG